MPIELTFTDDVVGVHPYADKFPMLPENELEELAESIGTNGLRNPIVVTPGGLIIDGRNRWAACEIANVDPTVEEYDGEDIAEFVIDCNVTRRNMSTGARAMATALVLQADGRRLDNGRWKRGSVQVGNGQESISETDSAWVKAMKCAGIVLDYASELAADVVNGDMTLNAAYEHAESFRTSADRKKIMEREKKKREKAEAAAEAERNAQIVADLTMAGQQKYLDLIDSEAMTPQAAWAAYREDTRREREQAEQARQGRSDLYTGIARGLLTVGSYGAYDDIPALMAEYNADELNPPQLDRYYEVANLESAQRFIAELIEWRKNYEG